MTTGRTLGVAATAASVAVLAAGALVAPEAAYAGGKARGKLYSTAAVNRFCKEAQLIIANTTLAANNIVFDDLGDAGPPATGFIGSDALPYDGATDLPLTTTQYVGYGLNAKGKEIPQTIMCKMKSFDALDFYYPGSVDPFPPPPSFLTKPTCSDVTQTTYAAVMNSLTRKEAEALVYGPDDIVFEDWQTYSGLQWTDGAPAQTSYIGADGKLHLVGKELYVPRVLPFPVPIPDSKKGVDYCQVIAAEYLRDTLIGKIAAPNCDAPPQYMPGGPPFPQPWNCPPSP